MTTALQVLHCVAGLLVLAEALNKLERTCPAAPGLTARQRLVDGLKAIAWALLALGSAGAVATPILVAMGYPVGAPVLLLRLEQPTLSEVCVMVGFAVLIIRARVME